VRRSRTLRAGARVVRQTVRDVWAAQAMEWAAALACYGVLSVFPLLLAGAAVASYVVAPSVVTARLSLFVEGILPAGVVDIDPIVSAAIAARGQVGLSVIVLWVLAGRRILGALVTALDRVSDVDARHETVRRRALVELAVLAGIGLLFLLALMARSLLGFVWEAVWGSTASTPLAWVVGAAVHLLLLVLAFFALYTVVPHGERNARAALIGAIAATVLVLIVRAIFVAVLDRLWASFELIYGPLTLAALLLTWGWLLGLIILFGGSLASHVKVMVIEGRSPSEAERRHVAHKVGV
jgi:membrane protein